MSRITSYSWIVEATCPETGRTLQQSVARELRELVALGHDLDALGENERLVLVRYVGKRIDRAIVEDATIAPRFFANDQGERTAYVPWHLRNEYRKARKR